MCIYMYACVYVKVYNTNCCCLNITLKFNCFSEQLMQNFWENLKVQDAIGRLTSGGIDLLFVRAEASRASK